MKISPGSVVRSLLLVLLIRDGSCFTGPKAFGRNGQRAHGPAHAVSIPAVDEAMFGGLKLSWEAGVADSIRHSLDKRKDNSKPYMVSFTGIPGCGKTTSCHILSQLLSDVGCVVIPFDGYHYPLSVLETFENPRDAIYRRGAPDTFDAKGLLSDLLKIRDGTDNVLHLPGFDHGRGDPEPGAHEFRRDAHQVVLCEGLYLLHDQDGWEEIDSCFDLSVFVGANVDICVERLKTRNKCIPGYTPEEIEIRCDVVDRANAMTVENSKKRAKLVVSSAT